MDTTLVMVTLLSLGMAGALSVIVWRMLRDDRERSDARVAALATLAARPAPAPRIEVPPAAPRPSPRRPIESDLPMRDLPVHELTMRPAPIAAGAGDLFV